VRTARGPESAHSHRTALDARRRHARRYVDDEAIEQLERLEEELSR
jgi:hypothetical protein